MVKTDHTVSRCTGVADGMRKDERILENMGNT